ncbi:MAG: MMPL family transporter [Lachnospiraceae bacterium]|jgi:predicted RND superfamily exporter protein|nr:MMPL family transporter [Lachnospiraceae bacterium]MCI1726101.1 MMPL family transporter [Lachnospiraceae bacterium]
MRNFGKAVVKSRFIILAVAIALLLPSVWGMVHTRVNYDMLTYLPSDIETMKGQDILENQFGTGAISMMVVDGMDNKDVAALKQKILAVDHVKDVYWYDSLADLSIPVEALPQEVQDAFFKDDSTLMFIVYDTTTSSDATMQAATDIRSIANQNCFLAGVTAVIVDTKNLTEQEEPIYVGIAVALAFIVLMFAMDTFLAPVFFLLSIGMAILYNMGSNYFFGQISYITKAISAVLQLGVTMDYSIFLWHSFEEYEQKYKDDKKRAMSHAISATLQSVIGSSVTTIAGFIALCFMSFTFGLDIGLVMAKGVLFGVISCVTILPSMILIFDPLIEKTKHRPLIPKFSKLPGFVAKHYKAILIAFAIIWIPAIWGYMHTGVYYELDKSLPSTLASVEANQKLQSTFDMSATHMVLADNSVSSEDISEMCDEMKKVDGVKNVLGIDALLGSGFPKEMLPDKIKDALTSDQYQLIIINSEYKTASDAVNTQIDTLNTILKKYDSTGMLIGDAPCTKDLITISNHDLNVVNWVSIALIFLIVLFVFKSFSLPVLLVSTIEFAIFINMGIPGFTGTKLPFIASIVIGTIQLGSTVDYAILMTSRYQKERSLGKGKVDAITIAHTTSLQSIFVSGLSFFAATFGVGMYSNISIISSMCILMARGALISMVTVMTVLPAILTLFDPVIVRTSKGFLPETTGRKKLHVHKMHEAA